ncbi:MAG: type II toxin-antitoxin system VapC family toxin [Deltaproteobacteria bacterium]|nr:type II toxin-antitoxin system VapC family toxin [Deltaproteobacteria bacterium]
MIAVDTNVLVYAHRTETNRHDCARQWLTSLAEGLIPWGLPVFCLGEFVRVVTHRRVFDPPSSVDQAMQAVRALLQSPSLRLLNPGPEYPLHFEEAVREGRAVGNLVFDAQIAAICREHGVETLLTDDHDFSRFPALRILSLDREPGRP